MTDLLQEGPLISNETNVAALLAAGAALGKPFKGLTPDGKPFTIVPEGFTLQTLPEAELPTRPVALAKLRDAASFIRYFKDHACPRSRVYAQLDPAKFLAVFDEFDIQDPGEQFDTAAQADWRQFRAEFAVPPSREWQTWHAINRKDLGQLSFAEFLQDNLPDVVKPDGAELLDMALNFEAMQGGKVVAVQRLQDGSQNLQFQAEANASGSVKLPPEITLQIPVFENDEPVQLQARLKYRIKRDDGSITFKIELVRPHKVLEQAFRRTWARIESEAGAVILLGSPE